MASENRAFTNGLISCSKYVSFDQFTQIIINQQLTFTRT